MDRLTPGDVYDLLDAYTWRQEQPEALPWAVSVWLKAMGSQIPWTARTLLGRPEHDG